MRHLSARRQGGDLITANCQDVSTWPDPDVQGNAMAMR